MKTELGSRALPSMHKALISIPNSKNTKQRLVLNTPVLITLEQVLTLPSREANTPTMSQV